MNTPNVPIEVLVMCLSDPSGDPRPGRAAEFCASQGFNVSVMGYPPRKKLSVKTFYPLPFPLPGLLNKIIRRLWSVAGAVMPFERGRVFWEKKRFGLTRVKEAISGKRFDLLIVEDIQLLPLAFEIRGGGKILFDAREYYPRQNEGAVWFDLLEKPRRVQLCRDYMTRCDAVVTVSEGLRREYLKEFGIAAEVHRSTPPYVELPVRPANPENIRLVYHGGASRDRRLENLIDVISLLDNRFTLDLILTSNPKYQRGLRRKAAGMDRLGVVEPVPFEDIIPTIGQYDIGFFYSEPTTFNLRHCLPNKLFEYIQARLMIAIGPSPDMTELVKKYGCGVISKEFSVESMARALNSLSVAEIDGFKRKSDLAARELCFEKESEKMVALIKRLLGLVPD